MALKQEPVDIDADHSTPVFVSRSGASSSGQTETQPSFLQTDQPIFPPRSVVASSERTISLPRGVVAEMTSPHTVIEHMTSPPANFLTDQTPGPPLQIARPERPQDPNVHVEMAFLPPRARGGRGGILRDVIQYPTYSIAHNEAEVNSKFLPKKYRCRFCVYKTSYKSDLNRHLRKHGLAMQHCPLCNMPFKTTGNLENHVRHAHGEVGSPMYCAGMGIPIGAGGGGEAGNGGPVPVALTMSGEVVTIPHTNPAIPVFTARPSPPLQFQQQQQQQLYQERSSASLPNYRHFTDGRRNVQLTESRRYRDDRAVRNAPDGLGVSRGKAEDPRRALDNRDKSGVPPPRRHGNQTQITSSEKSSMCLPHIPAVERSSANTRGSKRLDEPLVSDANDDSSDVIVLSPDVTTVPIFIDEDDSPRVDSVEGDNRGDISPVGSSGVPETDQPSASELSARAPDPSSRCQSKSSSANSETPSHAVPSADSTRSLGHSTRASPANKSEENLEAVASARKSDENLAPGESLPTTQRHVSVSGADARTKSARRDGERHSLPAELEGTATPSVAETNSLLDVESSQASHHREESHDENRDRNVHTFLSGNPDRFTQNGQRDAGNNQRLGHAAPTRFGNQAHRQATASAVGSAAMRNDAHNVADSLSEPDRHRVAVKQEPREMNAGFGDGPELGASASREPSQHQHRGRFAGERKDRSGELQEAQTTTGPSANKKRRYCLAGSSGKGNYSEFENVGTIRGLYRHRVASASCSSSGQSNPIPDKMSLSDLQPIALGPNTGFSRAGASHYKPRPSHPPGDRVLRHPPSSGRYAQLVSDFDDFSAKPYACSLCFFRTASLGELRVHCENHLTGCNVKPIPETAHFHRAPTHHADSATSPVCWMSSGSSSPAETFRNNLRASADSGFVQARDLQGHRGDHTMSPEESDSEGEHMGQGEDMDSDFDMTFDLPEDRLGSEGSQRLMYTEWPASDQSDDEADEAGRSEAFPKTAEHSDHQSRKQDNSMDGGCNNPNLEDNHAADGKEQDSRAAKTSEQTADDVGHSQQGHNSDTPNPDPVSKSEDRASLHHESEHGDMDHVSMQTSTVTSSLSAPQPPAPTVPSEPTSLPKVPESASCGKNARKVERTRSGLRIQEKWFSLERAFRCGKCGKSFSLRPVLVRHMKTMHSSCELKTLQGPEDTGSVE